MSTLEAQLWTAVLGAQCISVDEAWHTGPVGEDPKSYQHGTNLGSWRKSGLQPGDACSSVSRSSSRRCSTSMLSYGRLPRTTTAVKVC